MNEDDISLARIWRDARWKCDLAWQKAVDKCQTSDSPAWYEAKRARAAAAWAEEEALMEESIKAEKARRPDGAI